MLQLLVDKVFTWLPWTPTMKVTLLGLEYDTSVEEQREAFLQDFRSRLLLSYRSGIPVPLTLVGGRQLDSDTGWGCMLRVQQMMLAQCFLDLTVGREWRHTPESDCAKGSVYLDILSCFLDVPGAPLSLHALVDAGQRLMGKEPSAWFGPTSAARAAGHLLERASSENGAGRPLPDSLRGVACAVFEDGAIYRASVSEMFAAGARAVIVLVCRRLGLDEFNIAEYRAGVEACFQLPEFQGLASGNSGSSAHFFVGTHGDSLLFLDPHRTLPAITSVEPFVASGDTAAAAAAVEAAGVHPGRPLPLRWSRLNPSVCLGFLVRSPAAFEALCTRLTSAPFADVFEVLERQPNYNGCGEAEAEDGMVLVG